MLAILFLGSLQTAQALEDDFELSLEGYYRMRSYTFKDLYEDYPGKSSYLSQRLRIQPEINFQDRAKLMFMTDILDDVVWGDNQSISSTALFSEIPSNTSEAGTSIDSFALKRAWMEIDLAVGKLRVGRQPSHWGMGLLANSGDGFDDPFGENHAGANFDRILFATKPIAVAQTLMGKTPADIPFYMGYAFDRLVEDPLIEYYGYECTKGIPADDEDYNPDCYNEEYDIGGSGETNLEHSYTDDSRQDTDRDGTWTLDNDDDVTEHVFLGIYKGENIDLFGSKGDLTIGLYGINRNQVESNSDVWIYDAYLYFLWKKIYMEGEILNIRGKSAAIALPGAINTEEGADPLTKDVDIWGYAARAGYKTPTVTAYFETGYASGDDNVADGLFTGRAIHPDYNVGLLLYDEVLDAVSAARWQGTASALASGGGVYNSRYIFPVVSTKVLGKFDLVGGFLKVWPDRPDGAVIQCAEGDDSECETYEATADHIGWEGNLALKGRLHEHFLFSFEGGYAEVTDRLKLDAAGLNPDGKFMTIQTRLAYEF
ncbi:MAG: hypothetical protein VXZ96_04165 [Myxococcota bacterium]|nr:hypothetical protein [Myxococcota bacterium]